MAKYKIINGEGIIPNGTTEIEYNAFKMSSKLKSITIPESVTKIGKGAFCGCRKLTSINIPESVTEIGDSAFSWCRALTSVTIPNSVTEIGDSAFNECNALTSINIPDSVTKIGENALLGCEALTSINIPDSVTKIGENALLGCTALTSINIPESVTKIGYHAFYGCGELTSIIVAEENKVYDSRNNCNAIIETKTNRLIQGCANTFMPHSVTEIGNEAFRGCSALTSINIPESVTWIGEYAFIGCGELTSIIVAEENKVYDSRNNCNAIIKTKTNRLIQGCANTVIPESVTEIGEYAFEGRKILTSINIPNSVSWIGDWAFSGCENLKEIILFQTDPSKIKVTESSGLQKTQITLYVPKEGVAAYQEHWFWSKCAEIKPITDDMLK